MIGPENGGRSERRLRFCDPEVATVTRALTVATHRTKICFSHPERWDDDGSGGVCHDPPDLESPSVLSQKCVN